MSAEHPLPPDVVQALTLPGELRPPTAPGHSRAVLAIACAVALMTVLDVSVVTVALPAVRADLGLSADRAAVGGQRLQR